MITVYTQPSCMPCKMAIKMIDESGVDYQVKDISQDEKAYEWVKGMGLKTTPIIYRPSEPYIEGFRPDEIREMIDRESAPTTYGEGTWIH